MATVKDLVEKYIRLRDKKAAMKAEFSKKTEKIDATLEQIEGVILHLFNAQGLDSVKTEEGTAYKSARVSAKVEDWDAALAFIIKNKMWHMLERRVGKEAVAQYNAEHGQVPPGVTMSEEITINVRRS